MLFTREVIKQSPNYSSSADRNSSAVTSKLPLIMNPILPVVAFPTYHLALHCFADFRCSKEAIRDHWFLPYFITAAFRISSLERKECMLLWRMTTGKMASLSSRRQHNGFHLMGCPIGTAQHHSFYTFYFPGTWGFAFQRPLKSIRRQGMKKVRDAYCGLLHKSSGMIGFNALLCSF